MSELPTLLSNWLYNVVQPQYVEKQLTYTHLYQFLQVHYGKNFRLKIRTSVYTSLKSGRLVLLLNIFGSIPLTLSSLKVPIQIWIPLAYPYGNGGVENEDDSGVPMVYIIPDAAKGILIHPGNHVDNLGRFYHPYLSSWYHECKQNGPNSRKYSIVELLKLLQQSFGKSCPIVLKNTHEGQTLGSSDVPPLPSKIQINPVQPQLTGPPLPAKPGKRIATSNSQQSIPLKYQSPLPLPGDIGMSPHATGMDPQYQQQQYLIQRNLESPHSTGHDQRHGGSYTSPDQNLYKSTPLQSPQLTGIYQKYQNGIENQYNVGLHGQETQPQPQPQLQFYQPIQSNIQPKISNVEDSSNKSGELFLDLIDEDRRGQLPEKSILESNEINSKIQDAITNTLQEGNSSLRLVYSNQERINSLYNQLSHHHKQAVANNSNLESHMKYLAQQKSAILQLNKELTRIEENNLKEIDLVYINGQTSVQLDSLISPDLALVNQLYDIVSEIKATKDVIDLIGGNFRNEGELIKDSNMETSVRTVRTLAREVFWLEVMKDEIAGIMNLS